MKKVSGIKLRIGADILELPHTTTVTTVNITDRTEAINVVEYYYNVTDCLSTLKKVLVDGGYAGGNFSHTIKALSHVNVEVVKRNVLHTFAVPPKRSTIQRLGRTAN